MEEALQNDEWKNQKVELRNRKIFWTNLKFEREIDYAE